MQSQSGVRQEVAAMYEKHGHVVLRRARRILGDEHEAQDVLHEIFASLLQKPDAYAGHSSVTTFLYTATTNRCLNRLRDTKTRSRLLHLERREEGAGAPEGIVAARELLARLPEDQAQALIYYYLDDMTHEEIAEQVGCSRRTVGNLLARAAALFREETTP
jgi:RNA polymerase sigma-70 factor (ECF subfamily)